MGRSNFQAVGGKELSRKLDELGRRGVQAALRGIQLTCLEILNDAKTRLSNGGQRVTGKLFNSGKVARAEEQDAYEIAFGSPDKEVEYATYVEFGRRPGKRPPIDAIKQWVDKKHLSDTYSIKDHSQSRRGKDYEKRRDSVAWAVANSIAKKGTRAHPFLFPAFEAKKGNVGKNIGREIAKLIKELETK